MSNDFWAVLGKACCQNFFRKAVMYRTRPNPTNMKGLRDLHQYLVNDPCSFRLTRRELMEFNEVLRSVDEIRRKEIGSDDGVLAKIYEEIGLIWQEEPTNSEVHEFIGLACIDDMFVGRFWKKSAEDFSAELVKPPKFELSSEKERERLRALMHVDKVREYFKTVDVFGWKLGENEHGGCDAGFEESEKFTNVRLHKAQEYRKLVEEIRAVHPQIVGKLERKIRANRFK